MPSIKEYSLYAFINGLLVGMLKRESLLYLKIQTQSIREQSVRPCVDFLGFFFLSSLFETCHCSATD